MKTDTELEALLRTTLDTRAGSIVKAPAPPADLPVRGRRPTWFAVAAAAAAVVLIAAGVGLGVHLTSGKKSSPPATATETCPASLPAQWRSAIDDGLFGADGASTQPLSFASDGTVLAIQDDGPQPGSGRFLVRLRPDYTSDVLLNIADPDNQTVAFAQQYEKWLVVGLKYQPRPAKGTIPGSTPIGLRKIEVLDFAAHTSKTLFYQDPMEQGPAPQSNGVALYQGRVYWDQSFGHAGLPGVVYSYDLASGTQHTVYQGPIGWPQVTAQGLTLLVNGESQVLVPAPVPAQVEQAVTAAQRDRLATDGTAYAWVTSPRTVGWWAPGQAEPRYRELPKGAVSPTDTNPPVVAGRFVLTSTEDGGFAVTDMISGGSALLPDTAGRALRPDYYLSQDGVLAGLGFTESKGHFVDGYWADPAMIVLRLDTNTLPPLTC